MKKISSYNVQNILLPILSYLSIFIIGFFIANLIFLSFKFSYINDEKILALISIIIQSEIVIFSIIISVSIIAIQLYSGSFTSYAGKFFSRLIDFWLLTAFFVGSIFFQLIMILNSDFSSSSITSQILYSNPLYWIFTTFFVSFLFIFLYFWRMFQILNPQVFTRNFTDNVLLGNKIEREQIQILLELFQYAIQKNDRQSSDLIISVLLTKISKIPDSNKEESINRVIEFLYHSSLVCMKFDDETSLKETLNKFLFLCSQSDIILNESSLNEVIESFRKIGIIACDKGWFWSVISIAELLISLGFIVINRQLEQPLDNLHNSNISLGIEALKCNLPGSLRSVIKATAKLIEYQIEKKFFPEFKSGFYTFAFLSQHSLKEKFDPPVLLMIRLSTDCMIKLLTTNIMEPYEVIFVLFRNIQRYACDYCSDGKIMVEMSKCLHKMRCSIENKKFQCETTQMMLGFKRTCEKLGYKDDTNKITLFLIDERFSKCLPNDWMEN